jgi:hypothetical protein
MRWIDSAIFSHDPRSDAYKGIMPIEKLLALPHDTMTATLTIALYHEAFTLARRQSDIARMISLAGNQLSLCQAQSNQIGIARSVLYLTHVAVKQGDFDRAAMLAEESMRLSEMIGNQRRTAEALSCVLFLGVKHLVYRVERRTAQLYHYDATLLP